MRRFALAIAFVLSLQGIVFLGASLAEPEPGAVPMPAGSASREHLGDTGKSGQDRSGGRTLLFLGNQSLPPMNSMKKGKPAGIVVDLAEALAERMSQPVEIRLMDWNEAQQLVLDGQADALLQINANPERLKLFDFSDPLLVSEFMIFTHVERQGIESLNTLRGMTVGVEKAGLPILLLQEDPRINVKVIPDFVQGFEMLTAGLIDAVVADRWVGTYVLAENNIQHVKVIEKPISTSHSAIAVKKGNTELLADINAALAAIRSDGTYGTIIERWRPKEVVYKTREQLRQEAWQWSIAAISLVLLVALAGIAAQAREIRRRRRSEEALRKSQTMLNMVLDTVPQSIFWKDREGRYLGCNLAFASAMGLDDPKQIIGRKDSDLPGWLREAVEACAIEDQEMIKQNHPKHCIVKPQHPADGSLHWIDVCKIPLENDTGRPFAVLGVCEDITDRKRMQELLIQSEKMSSIGLLAAGLAHEINNPLSAVLQSMQALLLRLSMASPKNESAARDVGCSFENIKAFLEARDVYTLLEGVRDSGARAAQIVSNMLEFSRKTETKKTDADINALLGKAVELCSTDYDLKTKYDFRKIEIVQDFEPDLPMVPCIPVQIEQVILNLLRNAAQAMQESGKEVRSPRILLRTRRDVDTVLIEVHDNGPGMDEGALNHIFDPFYTTKEVGKGTGLGLSVSYFIITQKHGGTILIESTLGSGSTFMIRLPIRDPLASSPEE